MPLYKMNGIDSWAAHQMQTQKWRNERYARDRCGIRFYKWVHFHCVRVYSSVFRNRNRPPLRNMREIIKKKKKRIRCERDNNGSKSAAVCVAWIDISLRQRRDDVSIQSDTFSRWNAYVLPHPGKLIHRRTTRISNWKDASQVSRNRLPIGERSEIKNKYRITRIRWINKEYECYGGRIDIFNL